MKKIKISAYALKNIGIFLLPLILFGVTALVDKFGVIYFHAHEAALTTTKIINGATYFYYKTTIFDIIKNILGICLLTIPGSLSIYTSIKNKLKQPTISYTKTILPFISFSIGLITYPLINVYVINDDLSLVLLFMAIALILIYFVLLSSILIGTEIYLRHKKNK